MVSHLSLELSFRGMSLQTANMLFVVLLRQSILFLMLSRFSCQHRRTSSLLLFAALFKLFKIHRIIRASRIVERNSFEGIGKGLGKQIQLLAHFLHLTC